jgi:hypothetical protein
MCAKSAKSPLFMCRLADPLPIEEASAPEFWQTSLTRVSGGVFQVVKSAQSRGRPGRTLLRL